MLGFLVTFASLCMWVLSIALLATPHRRELAIPCFWAATVGFYLVFN